VAALLVELAADRRQVVDAVAVRIGLVVQDEAATLHLAVEGLDLLREAIQGRNSQLQLRHRGRLSGVGVVWCESGSTDPVKSKSEGSLTISGSGRVRRACASWSTSRP